MPHEKTIGKPDAGNPHVRFERGPQETERAPMRLRSTNEAAILTGDAVGLPWPYCRGDYCLSAYARLSTR